MGARTGGTDWVAAERAFQRAQDRPELLKYRHRRWNRQEEFAGWIAESALPSLTMEQAVRMYWASGGNRREEFTQNDIAEVRESLDFLLYDTVKLEGRFQECATNDGAYNLPGTGKEFVSYLLCVKDPTLFAVWNSTVERAMRRLEVPMQALRKGPLGVAYVDLLEGATLMCRRLGLPDFRSLDLFAYSVTRPHLQRGV